MMLFLTGFMACGKSTVGRQLARRLGYFYLDTDSIIEKEQNCTIAEIFSFGGEQSFRDLETQLLKRLRGRQNTVVSTGGGMIVRPENRELMRSMGKVVYLKVSDEELIRRLHKDYKRPLMHDGKTPEERVSELMQVRRHLYDEAELIILSQGLTPSQTATEIIRNL